jgi:hypothetical protein
MGNGNDYFIEIPEQCCKVLGNGEMKRNLHCRKSKYLATFSIFGSDIFTNRLVYLFLHSTALRYAKAMLGNSL